MVGALSVVGSSVVDPHTSPCLCLDALPGGDLVLQRSSIKRKQLTRPVSLELRSSFVDSWHDWRLSSKAISVIVSKNSSRKQRKDRGLVVVNELAGQYEDSFGDVKMFFLMRGNSISREVYFEDLDERIRSRLFQTLTRSARLDSNLRSTMHFVAQNKPGDGKRFIRSLGKEKQDLAERVMVTRLHLYGKWVKKCDHAEIYKEMSDENLELMRERLMEIVKWPSDDTNTEQIG